MFLQINSCHLILLRHLCDFLHVSDFTVPFAPLSLMYDISLCTFFPFSSLEIKLSLGKLSQIISDIANNNNILLFSYSVWCVLVPIMLYFVCVSLSHQNRDQI